MPIQKYSRQRESIKLNINSRTDHPTADMVYSDIRKQYPNVSLGTVYRNLSLLADTGEIKRLVTSDGIQRFDRTVAPHSHFICRKCGCVSDLFKVDAEEILKKADASFDGTIDECELTFYGLCPVCSKISGSN